ncbi:Uncharacterized protein Adt_37019 [Abeliophyllum distichum]|uniref:Uncharacterized protein n=1 Tax=Abeliophyllum distichum TaxID=126358 RepID=A0ABD1QJ77_9LAMI
MDMYLSAFGWENLEDKFTDDLKHVVDGEELEQHDSRNWNKIKASLEFDSLNILLSTGREQEIERMKGANRKSTFVQATGSDLPEANNSGEANNISFYIAGIKPIGDWPRTLGQDEKAAQKIIRKVHPTVVSKQRRREDIDYVQRLIGNSLDSEVFPYGSVPLKTYLSDGDINLSAFGTANLEDKFTVDLKHVVEGEERNKAKASDRAIQRYVDPTEHHLQRNARYLGPGAFDSQFLLLLFGQTTY